MKDARWLDVLEAAGSASRHFQAASDLFAGADFAPGTRDGYIALMALLHAMQSGHSSTETALLRTLSILDEHPPTGADWHARLIARCGTPIPDGRGAIIPPDVARWAQETRAFRHLAMHSYDVTFDRAKAARAVDAGARLATALPPSLRDFASRIDP